MTCTTSWCARCAPAIRGNFWASLRTGTRAPTTAPAWWWTPVGLLKEMGLELPESTEVRVVDSTAETRYLVVPRRPEGTEGWSEEQLAGLVTRNSMVGCSNALTPLQKEMMAD